MESELMLGSVGASVILLMLLNILYGYFDIPGKAKPLLAVAIGIILGLAAMVYQEIPFTAKTAIQYIVHGFMTGCTVVGLKEMTKKKKKPVDTIENVDYDSG